MQAPRDENRVTAKLGVLNTDGVTLVPIATDESTGFMKTTTTATISFTMTPIVPRDDNSVTCITFMGTDGEVYPWVVTSDGEVLIEE
jgi:hypothetical protein